MSQATAYSRKFSGYRQMVAALADEALRNPPAADGPDVLLGCVPARLMLADDPALHPALAAGFKAMGRIAASHTQGPSPRLLDSVGHHRDVYYPLVLHLHLRAFARRYETLSPSLWAMCEDVLAACVEPVRCIEDLTDSPPPLENVALTLWQALCLVDYAELTRRDVDMELADAVVHQIASHPGQDGSLHGMTADQSLDAWTYRELCGLHALANLALGRRNRTWARRVEQVALYHLQNTQPDNVTTQPWAVFAFFWTEATASFAEQQLHDATTQGVLRPNPAEAGDTSAATQSRAGAGRIAGMLLADAADALAAFET